MKGNPQAPSNGWQGRRIENHGASSRNPFGAQKRLGSDALEGPSKKPKVSYAPRLGKIFVQLSTMLLIESLQLVTKPFSSTSGLSKPFRPPSFVRPQVGLVTAPIPAAAEKPQLATVVREPSIDLELPELSEEDNEELECRERRLMRNPCIQLFTHIFIQSHQ